MTVPFKAPSCFSSLFNRRLSFHYSHSRAPSNHFPHHRHHLGFPPAFSSRLFSADTAGSLPRALMEVAKGVLSRASENHERVAIRAENKSYSYVQLISSACKISSLLCSKDFKSMCGSSALPYPVLKQWEAVTGHRLLERYGMTEFVMAISNPLHGTRKGGTVGKPLPRVEVKIIAEDGNEVGSKGGVGELCVRSPSQFKEYWKRPEVTNVSFRDGGFFMTGDTVKVDEDGYYVILGRSNADIMKVGGFKLSALEIEAVLLEHESVSECCVLGVPDKDYGEIVCAIIVPHEDAKTKAGQELRPVISLGELRNWSKDKLAPYKIPTSLFLWDTLPRNAMGKVNKKELKRLLEERNHPN